MLTAARLFATLTLSAMLAYVFHAKGEKRLEKQNIKTTYMYRSVCDFSPGDTLTSKCIKPVRVTNVSAVRHEFTDILLGDGIKLVKQSRLVRPVKSGQTFRRDHFDVAGRPPIPANNVLMTVRVDSSRVPGRLAPGVVVDLYAGARNRDGGGKIVAQSLKIISVDNREWSAIDEGNTATTHLAFFVPKRLAPSLVGKGVPFSVAVRSWNVENVRNESGSLEGS